MNVVKLARPEIQTLVPYEAAVQVDDAVRLNANESPYETAHKQYRRPLNRYPEIRPANLRYALADRFQCGPEQLLVTRGSSEAIDLVIRAFCRAGKDNIVVPAPSFSMYSHYAKVQGAEVIEVVSAPEQDFRIDVGNLIDACDENTRIVFVCSPNNPTGATIRRADLIRLIEARRENSVVVVDEAYVEFSRDPSTMDLLENYPNLLVLRTLSKALGFAGARCGAVAGDPAVVSMLAAIQAPYALATPVVECVEDVLASDALAAAEKTVAVLIEERERLREAVAAFSFVEKVYRSDANFFLMRVADAKGLLDWCAARKILLRRFSDPLADCIRVSVGSAAENDLLLDALQSMEDVGHAQ